MATSRSMTSMASTSQSLLIKSQCSNAHSNPNPKRFIRSYLHGKMDPGEIKRQYLQMEPAAMQ